MASKLVEPRTRRWTLPEYYRMAEDGYFQGQRVQLIRGEIVEMPPHGHLHFLTLDYAVDAIKGLFGSGFWVRVQGPVNVAVDSAPEPDIAVVRGDRTQHADTPTTAVLVVEVGDSTLSDDRRSAGLYAAAGISDYWIFDARRRRLELYRQPIADETEEAGFRYAETRMLSEAERIAPLALPEKLISVSTLFPPAS